MFYHCATTIGQPYVTNFNRRHDTHNDIQHNDTQHNNKKRDTLHNGNDTAKLNDIYTECCYAESVAYADCPLCVVDFSNTSID